MQKRLFADLGLSPETLKAVARMGYEEASPIQSEAIPALLSGRDIVGQSQTGSGKTAAFAIPAIERVDQDLRAPQILILCPTRELAVQVAEEVAKLKFYKPRVRELPIYGGASYERQFRGLQAGAQIVIGTPGRIIDHLDRRSLNLSAIKMVVLDECDRMLDMGFREDIERILQSAPPERQTVFFSATMPRPIQILIQRFGREPQMIQIASQTVEAPNIEQVYYEVGRGSKLEVLCRLIDLQDIEYGIIFCSTKMMVDELTEHLAARGYAVDKLHGDLSQAMRERTMRRFREKKAEFLVATDVAARGLDVENVEVVFNYDLPQDPEDYVHRIGRTGRAGRKGRAITFVAGREIYKVQQILRFTKGRIRREDVPSLNAVEEKRTSSLFETLRQTLEQGDYPRYDESIDRLLDGGHTATDIASALVSLLAGDKRTGASIPEDNPKAARSERGPRGDYPKYVPRGRAGAPESAAPSPSADAPEPPQRAERRPPGDTGFPGSEELSTGSPRPAKKREHAATPVHTSRPHRAVDDDEPSLVSHEAGMVRLSFNQGREQGIAPGDIVGVIAGVTRLPRESVGAIKLLPRQSLVDVAEEHAGLILKKLNGIRFKGQKLLVRPATGPSTEEKPRKGKPSFRDR